MSYYLDRVKKSKESLITLIKYFLTNQDPNIREIEAYFSNQEETSKVFALTLYQFLKEKDDATILKAHRTKIAFNFAKGSFTGIGYSGKIGRKYFLQINTDFDITSLSELVFEDRFRGVGVKMKGSLGNERYEIFFQNQEQLRIFINFLETQL